MRRIGGGWFGNRARSARSTPGFAEGGHGGVLDMTGRDDGEGGAQDVVDVIGGRRACALRNSGSRCIFSFKS